MRIIIRMKSIKNMLLNEAILGYVPSAVDPDRYCDQEFNLQVHFPHKYDEDKIHEIANALREFYLPMFKEFDNISIKVVRHKPYDGAYFHHMPSGWVGSIPADSLPYMIYSQYLAGCIRTKSKDESYQDSVKPSEVFITNKDSKPIKD